MTNRKAKQKSTEPQIRHLWEEMFRLHSQAWSWSLQDRPCELECEQGSLLRNPPHWQNTGLGVLAAMEHCSLQHKAFRKRENACFLAMLLHANKTWRRLDMFLTRHSNGVLFCSTFCFLGVNIISVIETNSAGFFLVLAHRTPLHVGVWVGFASLWQIPEMSNWKGGRIYFGSWVPGVFICAPGLCALEHVVTEHHRESTWWDKGCSLHRCCKEKRKGAWVSCILQGHVSQNILSSKIMDHHQWRTKLGAHELLGGISDWTTSKQAMFTW